MVKNIINTQIVLSELQRRWFSGRCRADEASSRAAEEEVLLLAGTKWQNTSGFSLIQEPTAKSEQFHTVPC